MAAVLAVGGEVTYQSLARSLIDCASVFDRAPHKLKSHIVTVFGIRPDLLEEYLRQSESDAA
jgi:hypothetical protein